MARLARILGSDNPLSEFYKAQSVLPLNKHAWREQEYLAVDLETTGLDSAQHEIISMGWVGISQGGLLLKSAEHHIVHSQKSVSDSAQYHLIRDVDVRNGESIEIVMGRLLSCLSGRIAIFHNAKLDEAFLNVVARRIYGCEMVIPTVDTMKLEHDKLRRLNHPFSVNDLRLFKCRERYHLPQYASHNALIDAIATAELYLAIMAHH